MPLESPGRRSSLGATTVLPKGKNPLGTILGPLGHTVQGTGGTTEGLPKGKATLGSVTLGNGPLGEVVWIYIECYSDTHLLIKWELTGETGRLTLLTLEAVVSMVPMGPERLTGCLRRVLLWSNEPMS